jgi:low temperature requirement protein LtrA
VKGAAGNLLRRRTGQGQAPVTPVELFFDLVFVFTVTQISESVRAHLAPLGMLHALMLLTAVWWVWVYTAWVTNWLDPQFRPVKLLLLVLMLFGLILSAALPEAFAGRGLAFGAALAGMQIGRSGFMLWALRRHDERNYLNFVRITVWLTAAGLLWIAGGLLPPSARTLVWLGALGVDLCSPVLGFAVPGLGRSATREWSIDAYHMAERCSGFILIALGESITVTGASFSALHWSAPVGGAAFAAFLGAACLWWIYFDRAAELTAEDFAKSNDPGRVARAAYTYIHGVLVGGIILLAAGDAFLLEEPLSLVRFGPGSLELGGAAVFLVGNGVFRRMLRPRFPPSHIWGLVFLAALAAIAAHLTLLELGLAICAVLLFVIVLSDMLFRQQECK